MKDNSAQKIVEKIIQVARLDNASVLEIGCGDGRITSLLVGKSKELVAIDPDKNRIDSAKKMISGADFQVGTGENLLFPDECFDLVVFTLSLHHQDSRKSLREATRVLKKNGLVLVIEPLTEGEVERVFSVVHNEDQAKLDAKRAITESGLSLDASEAFLAHWVFDDKDELINHLFDHYDVAFSSALAQQICGALGGKAQDRPLRLADHMIIYTLSKQTQSEVT